MSEVMCTVRDGKRALHATIHGSRIEPIIAALSAEPETIEELQTALGRFMHREEQERFFAHWSDGIKDEPWDAGVCVVDLAARLVACESTYSSPGRKGAVEIRDIPNIGSTCVPYHLADDWLFLREIECWQWRADERRKERLAAPPLDARAVLYGKVCEFIATECAAKAVDRAGAPADEDTARAIIRDIHARWLLTPRADLRGQCPRDLLVARHDHLSWDLQDRAEQWSELGGCPPGLSPDSAAYRFGGFGTHEIVIYYDLVRFLLWDCWEHLHEPIATIVHASEEIESKPTPLATASGDRDRGEEEKERLESLRDQWLQTPNFEDLSGRTPASVIERERQRLPEGVTGKEAMVDHDCPVCQMMADDLGGVYFWNLDGCNMDDDFAFAFYERTREEWDKKQQEYAKWDREFEERQRAREAAGQTKSVWQRSYANPDIATTAPTLILFGLGSHLAELTQDLKDASAEQRVIDDLNRVFGNLRDAAADPSAALVEPVIETMRESFAAIGDRNPELAPKCADLQRQLADFARRLSGEPFEDDELPF